MDRRGSVREGICESYDLGPATGSLVGLLLRSRAAEEVDAARRELFIAEEE